MPRGYERGSTSFAARRDGLGWLTAVAIWKKCRVVLTVMGCGSSEWLRLTPFCPIQMPALSTPISRSISADVTLRVTTGWEIGGARHPDEGEPEDGLALHDALPHRLHRQLVLAMGFAVGDANDR